MTRPFQPVQRLTEASTIWMGTSIPIAERQPEVKFEVTARKVVVLQSFQRASR
jgi:hypothetical protein